jgi:chlorobactene glucosyltransferase
MPCGFYLLAFTHDVEAPLDHAWERTTACGQFILVHRSAYMKAGGHSIVASALSEDVELARALKRRGFRTAMFGGERLISARMYDGYASLRTGVTRNLVDMLGGPVRALVTASTGVLVAWASVALPLSTLLTWSPGATDTAALFVACAASAAAFAFHIAGARHFGIPAWYGFLFPVGYTIGGMLVVESVWRRLTGRVVWKDRIYPGERHAGTRLDSGSLSRSQGS